MSAWLRCLLDRPRWVTYWRWVNEGIEQCAWCGETRGSVRHP